MEDVKQQELSSAIWNGTATLEEILAISYKKKTYFLAYDSAIILLCIYSNEVKSMSTQKLSHDCL